MPAKLHRIGGEGPPVILIHGFGGDRMGWVANTPALMEQYAVWAVDLPSHGEAEPGETTVPEIIRSVAQAIGTIEGPLRLIGHSLGAAIAAQLVAGAPDRFVKTVMIAPAAFGSGKPDGSFLQGFSKLQTEDDALELLGRLVNRKRLIQPAMAQYVLAHLSKPGRRAGLAAIAAAALDFEPAPLPKEAMLVWGDKDTIVPPNLALLDELAARGLLVPDAGHLPHVEAATRFNRAALDYLN